VYGSVLQCVAVCVILVKDYFNVRCSVHCQSPPILFAILVEHHFSCAAVCCGVLQYVAVYGSVLQCVSVC